MNRSVNVQNQFRSKRRVDFYAKSTENVRQDLPRSRPARTTQANYPRNRVKTKFAYANMTRTINTNPTATSPPMVSVENSPRCGDAPGAHDFHAAERNAHHADTSLIDNGVNQVRPEPVTSATEGYYASIQPEDDTVGYPPDTDNVDETAESIEGSIPENVDISAIRRIEEMLSLDSPNMLFTLHEEIRQQAASAYREITGNEPDATTVSRLADLSLDRLRSDLQNVVVPPDNVWKSPLLKSISTFQHDLRSNRSADAPSPTDPTADDPSDSSSASDASETSSDHDDAHDNDDASNSSDSESTSSSQDDDSSSSSGSSSSSSSSSSSDDTPPRKSSKGRSKRTPRKSKLRSQSPRVPVTQIKARRLPKTSSKKKKSKLRSSDKIFSELTKNAERMKLPILTNHIDPKRRRNAFIHFITKLSSVLNISRETNKMLRNAVDWRPPKSVHANNALFWLLEAYVDKHLSASLSELRDEIGDFDGLAGLYLLQGICAAQDEDEKHNAVTHFQSVSIEEGESIQHFNSRFNRLVTLVVAAGKSLRLTSKLRQYFRALQNHPATQILLEVDTWKQRFDARQRVTLSEVQLSLQRKEELLFPRISQIVNQRSSRPDRRSKHRHRKPHDHNHSSTANAAANATKATETKSPDATANAAQQKSILKNKRDIKCYGCGGNHALKDCPTTATADKKRIYNERRVKFERRPATANNVTRMAYINMTQARPDGRTREGRLLRRNNANNKREVQYVNGYPVVQYDSKVILDSGASDHMTSNRALLTDIKPYYVQVMMPDGFIVQCNERGTMRLSVKDEKTGTRFIVPLMDTLLVKGIHSHLISVPALNNSGISAQFNVNTAQLFINGNTITINDPYHRKANDAALPFATALRAQEGTPIRPAISTDAHGPSDQKVSLELMHQRMGHRSLRSIIAAEASSIWKGVKIHQGTDDYCVDCKIGGMPKANRGHTPPSQANKPGSVFFIDVIPNPADGGLTNDTSFKYYLIVVDAFSRYFAMIGMNRHNASAVIDAINQFCVNHRPHLDYTLNDLREIHVDAGSYFLSQEFKDWGLKNGITVISAAPEHQEMNGLAERLWQTARVMAFRMLTSARLPISFFHFALMYAWQICVVLPAKSTSRVNEEGNLVPTTPHYLYSGGKTPDVRRYRVFGCPVVTKVYKRPSSTTGRTLDHRNIVQRGVRGIFVGFPTNQAGWLVYIPASRRLLASADVSFDERFESIASMPDTIYHDSLAVRENHQPIGNNETLAFTGPPLYVQNETPTEAQWTPFSPISPDDAPDEYFEDEAPVVDLYQAAAEDIVHEDTETAIAAPPEIQRNTDLGIDAETQAMFAHYMRMRLPPRKDEDPESDESDDDDDDSVPPLLERRPDDDSSVDSDDLEQARDDLPDFAEEPTETSPTFVIDNVPIDTVADSAAHESSPTDLDEPTPPRRSERIRRRAMAYHVAHAIVDDARRGDGHTVRTYAHAVERMLGEPGTDPTPFHPEPRSVQQIINAPAAIRAAWTKAFYKELKGLIVVKQSFAIEDPLPDDPVIPLHAVAKCKLDKFGLIDKLKLRAVFRGDLYECPADEDPWNPHATWPSLKVFLGTCARQGYFPCQIDFIMAYVQAKMKGRVFVRIPANWKELLPVELHKWCGRPLRLLKALYGYTMSGRLLFEEQAEFMKEFGLQETSVIALWKKDLPDGQFLLVLQYSDDFLAAGPPEELERFKLAISKRFDVEIKPRADWYLQARLRQDADGNVLLDQQRYSKSIVQRYLPNSSLDPTPDDVKKYRSPLPYDFKWTKDDNSRTRKDVQALEDEYGFRYIEVVGSLNYLANTATEELFAIRKACRHMNLPGRKHFQGILHLLHHLRCHPTQAIVFYRDWRNAPVYKMLASLDIKIDDGTLIWFTDASHGDCDESRSTGCYMGFYQGGLVDMSSFVEQPIPHSTAESETIAMACGAMACSYIRQGVASVLYSNPEALWTVPMISDSTSAILINEKDKPTRRTRHIDRRWFYARDQCLQSRIKFHHVNDEYSLADLGTKNLSAESAAFKLSIVEKHVTDSEILSTVPKDGSSAPPTVSNTPIHSDTSSKSLGAPDTALTLTTQPEKGDGIVTDSTRVRTNDTTHGNVSATRGALNGTTQDLTSHDGPHGFGINSTRSGT